jgi:hypothetical protein
MIYEVRSGADGRKFSGLLEYSSSHGVQDQVYFSAAFGIQIEICQEIAT